MRNLYFIVFIAFALFSCKDHRSSNNQERIFLIAGQSNAVGVGNQETSFFKPKENAFEYNSIKDSLVVLKDPVGQNHLNFQSAITGSFSPSLAYHYLDKNPNKTVIVIQAAKGGSALTNAAEINNWGNWSENGKLFSASIDKVEKAFKITEKKEVDAIFWSQGENDGDALAKGKITLKAYTEALESLVKRFEKELGENIPFIIIETGRHKNDKIDNGNKKIREAQRQLAAKLKNVYIGYNETEFFIERGWIKDVVHYNQNALNDIGEKLAYFYYSLENKQ